MFYLYRMTGDRMTGQKTKEKQDDWTHPLVHIASYTMCIIIIYSQCHCRENSDFQGKPSQKNLDIYQYNKPISVTQLFNSFESLPFYSVFSKFSLFFFCDSSIEDTCPSGAFGAGGECYFFSHKDMNWYEAQEVMREELLMFYQQYKVSLFQFCWSFSGYLVEIADHSEDYALDEFLRTNDCYWIGLHGLHTLGTCISAMLDNLSTS